MAQNAIWSREFQTSIPRYQITRVLTIWHVKPTQSTALEQERFDVRSLSPAFHNLWLILVCLKSLIKDTNRKKKSIIHYCLLAWIRFHLHAHPLSRTLHWPIRSTARVWYHQLTRNNSLWRWLPQRLSKRQSLSTTFQDYTHTDDHFL